MITRLQQFVGTHRTLSAVGDMIQEHRLPQTLVVEGPAGSGKKTLARLIAAGLLCGEDAPCGECDPCTLVQKDRHPDVSLVRPLKDKAFISVDQIRDVRSDAFILPGQGNCKVFLIDGAMNDAAQNAFLKVLEEPPRGVYFIILCVHRSQLIDTVLSRAVVFTLGAGTYEEALPLLLENGISDDQNTKTCFEQEGCLIGPLLSEEKEDLAVAQIADALAFAVAEGSREKFLRGVAPAIENRNLYSGVLTGLYENIHGALACQITGEIPKDPMGLLSRRLTRPQLLHLADLIQTEQQKLPYNPNGWLFFTALCAEIFPRKR